MGFDIVYVAEEIYENSDNGFLALQNFLHSGTIARSYHVEGFVQAVLAQAGTGKISRLRVFGHGAPGIQTVGGGFGGSVPDPTHLSPSKCIRMNGNALFLESALARLKGRFESGAIVELHGCNVGKDTVGMTLVRYLAKFWNVRVRAGFEVQLANFFVDAYEGDTVEYAPDGALTYYEAGSESYFVIAPPVPQPAKAAPAPSPEAGPAAKTHKVGETVLQKDWLSSIAKAHYGDYMLWPVIFNANLDQFDGPPLRRNPNKVRPRSVFVIPDIGRMTAKQRAAIRRIGSSWQTFRL